MRRGAWLGLSLAGLLMALPIGWAAFALLLTAPGFALASRLGEKFTLARIAAMSLTLSLMAIPASALLTAPLPWHPAPYLLSLAVVAIGIDNYRKNRAFEITEPDALPLAIAGLVLAVVLAVSLRTFSFQDGGLYYTFTHGLDQTFHLSIALRYIAMPTIPPQDPYYGGASVAYDWFMHVMLGEVCRISGLPLFDVFKATVSVASALIFTNAYLLARSIFREVPAALAAALLYVLGGGLAWLYVLLKGFPLTGIDAFLSLVYQWPGIATLKYDPTALYFFLPQPQTFGLMAAAFCLYLLVESLRSRSAAMAAATGFAMASLVFYHLITALPVLATLLATGIYMAARKKDRPSLTILTIPIVMAGLAVALQCLLFPANAASQAEIGHHPDVAVTLIAALGPLIPFAAYGLYECRRDDGARLLAAFAGINLLLLNVVVLAMTNNTYRFLTYLALPVALFAGKGMADWLRQKGWKKTAAALAAIALAVPSSLMIAGFYAMAPADSLASRADVDAIVWIRDHTPVDAVIYERPDHFPRVPVISGRNVAYAGQTYVLQYHGVDLQSAMEAIMAVGDPEFLHDTLAQYGVSYVLDGDKESSATFSEALEDERYFKKAYDANGVRVYEVLGAAGAAT